MCNFTKQNVLRYISCNNSVLQNPYRHLDGITKKIFFLQFYGFSLFIGLYCTTPVYSACIVYYNIIYAIMQKQVRKLQSASAIYFF